MKDDTLKALVRNVLARPFDREWSVQGLGMLRTYLTDDRSARLHVWDDRLQVEDASQTHTHPWDMVSTVVGGLIRNTRLDIADGAPNFNQQLLLCGVGGGLEGAPQPVRLVAQPTEYISAVSSYTQRADEIHVSDSFRGTVTIVEREFGSDVDHAFVFWPIGAEWGSAEPRPASVMEIHETCSYALERWFA